MNVRSYPPIMFGNPYNDLVCSFFAHQFSADGDGFLYRRFGTGAGIRVSESERDVFVAEFSRKLRYANVLIISAAIPLIIAVALLSPNLMEASIQTLIYAGVGCIVAVFMGIYCWAWIEPARRLQRRPVLKQPLSREEARRVSLKQISYGDLALGLVAGLFLIGKSFSEEHMLRGPGLFWLICAGLLMSGVMFRLVQKWRSDRSA